MGAHRSGRQAEGGGLTEGGDDVRFFGRRRGRPLRPNRAALYQTLLPKISVPDPENGPIDPAALFADEKRALWVEIGFGSGEHLTWQAINNPDVGLIGAEPFESGVAACLSAIQGAGADNIRLHADDARPLLAALPEASVDRLFVLHPDPWRKRRHWERRFVGPAGLDRIARLLKGGAEFRTSTDHAGYQTWMLRWLLGDGRFEWQATCADDWRRRPEDWPETRYEAKAIREGRPVLYLRFRRRPRTA